MFLILRHFRLFMKYVYKNENSMRIHIQFWLSQIKKKKNQVFFSNKYNWKILVQMINYFYIWITPTVKFVLTHKLVYSYKTALELKLHSRKKQKKWSTNNNKNIYTNLITYHLYPLYSSYPNTKLFVTIYITINRENFVYVYSLWIITAKSSTMMKHLYHNSSRSL